MSISELISQMSATGGNHAVAQLERMFPESIFGLLMSGLPKAEPGQKHVVDGSGAVTMQFVSDPNGKRMIKACADPDLFSRNYPGGINATMTGRELLEMAEKIQDADGILLCSATSFHSYPIYRAAYEKLKQAQRADDSRKWWQLWKTAQLTD